MLCVKCSDALSMCEYVCQRQATHHLGLLFVSLIAWCKKAVPEPPGPSFEAAMPIARRQHLTHSTVVVSRVSLVILPTHRPVCRAHTVVLICGFWVLWAQCPLHSVHMNPVTASVHSSMSRFHGYWNISQPRTAL